MSKRIMSLLLCLTLVMTPAFNTYALEADDMESFGTVEFHEHQYDYTDNGDGTHDGICSVENCYYSIKNEEHDFLDGECTKCGAKEEVETVDETELVIQNGDEFNDENEEKKEELDEIEEIYPAFDQSATVNGVVVTVTASEGVFPSDAQLSVERVSRSDREFAEGAVEDVRDEDMVVAVSYIFDIKVLDSDGNEIQPTDEQSVTVSFSTVEVADSNLETDVYHISDDGEAEKLITETNGEEVSAETDGFSFYTVEFTYHELQYVMEGDSTISLNEILNTIGLEGEVSDVECSNEDLFFASKDGDDWIVTAHRAFTSEEWMKVIISDVVYRIEVTDAVFSDSITELINMTQEDYNRKVNDFIFDSRWKNGISYVESYYYPGNAYTCFGYACDFVCKVYDIHKKANRGIFYTDMNEVSAGDVIQSSEKDAYGDPEHTAVVLGRDGDRLWTAEANYSGKVRIGWDNYTLSNSKITAGNRHFTIGYHFVDIEEVEPTTFEYNDDGVLIGFDHTENGNITIPKGVVEIGVNAFNMLSIDHFDDELTSVIIPDTVKRIGEFAFCGAQIKEIVIPDSVEEIDSFCFTYSDLERIRVGSGVKKLDAVFDKCNKLTSAILSEGIEEIEYTFSYCPLLETVQLPSTLVKIGEFSFVDCTSLKTVILQNNLEIIDRLAFDGCSSLESIVLPDSLKEIGDYAFRETGLKKIVIPDNVEIIANGCFDSCSELEEAYIGKGVKRLGSVFHDCSKLKTVRLSEGTERLSGTFMFCTSLESIELPESLKVIDYGTFKGCSSLKSIALPNSTEKIYNFAFSETGITEIDIPSSVSNLGLSAFNNCRSLKKVTLPKGVRLDDNVFDGCTSLTDVYYCGTEEEWVYSLCGNYHVFDNCPQEIRFHFNYVSPIPEPTVAVSGVSVSPTHASLKIGETAILTANVSPNNASNKNVTWSSDNSNIATVDQNGNVTAVAPGSTDVIVTASDGGFEAKCRINVGKKSLKINDFIVHFPTNTAYDGSEKKVTVTDGPADYSGSISVKYEDGAGNVLSGAPKTIGTYTFSIVFDSDQNYLGGEFHSTTWTFSITSSNVPVSSVSISKTAISLMVNSSTILRANVRPEDASNKNITWSCDRPSVATVDQNGFVKAISVGVANITASSDSGNKTASCKVTVEDGSSPTPVTPTTPPTTTPTPKPTNNPEKKDSKSEDSSSLSSSTSSSSSSQSSSGSGSNQTPSNPNAVSVASFIPNAVKTGTGAVVGDVKISNQEQGPIAKFLFRLFTPAGWKEAFTFNLTVNGTQDYSLKKGKLTFYIPPTYRKQGRTFALISIVKPGQIKYFLDTDKNPETITVDLDCEGYAFDLIYFDLPTAATKK